MNSPICTSLLRASGSRGRRWRLLGRARRLGKEAQLGEGGADGRPGNAQAHLGGRKISTPHEAVVANAGASGELDPLSVLPGVEGKGLDALAERQILAQADDVKGHRLAQVEDQVGGGHVVIGGPVGIALVVEHIAGRKLFGVTADVAGGEPGATSEIVGEGGVEDAPEFTQGLNVVLVNAAAAVGRQVEVEAGAPAHRLVVDVEELCGRFHPGILAGVVEPAGANGNVALSRNPVGAGTIPGIEIFAVATGIAAGRVERGPARVAGDAPFVAHPARIRSGVAEHDGQRHQLADDPAGVVPVVVSTVIDGALFPGAAVKAIAAVGAVKPDAEDIAIVGQQLAELVAVVGDVFGAGVVFVVAVPGRKINAEFEALAAAGTGDFLDDVAFAILPEAVFDGVFGVLAGPEAEAVVVFGG